MKKMMMQKCIFPPIGCVFLWSILLSITFACASNSGDEPVVIDEKDQEKSVRKSIGIDKVWAGHPVGFALLTHNTRQYIAYYNAERHMVVGQRNLDEEQFELHELPAVTREEGGGTSTILNWDSHNSVTLGIDRKGYIHLSGNMHVDPITYFKSTSPNDITTLIQEKQMVGSFEKRCTYPNFMATREGELIFHYRDGGSGDGNEIYNIYDTETSKWARLLDTPLTDGQGEMNAYASQPSLREDDWYHMYWVWRDTPDCATNHDLSYIKSPDMVNWYNAFGEKVALPVTFDQKSVIVAAVPAGGGIINLAAKLCHDEDLNPIMAYHKYDGEGNLQFYVTKAEIGTWQHKQVTNWDYRWEFSGNGSINFDVRIGDFQRRTDGNYELGYDHIKYGKGTILLNQSLDPIGEVLKPTPVLAKIKLEGTFPGLESRSAEDLGSSEDGRSYMLKWETLPRNRDQPYPEPWPEPSQLYLLELE